MMASTAICWRQQLSPSVNALYREIRKILFRLFSTYMNKRWLVLVQSWDYLLTHQQQTAFEKIVGKGEIARDEQHLLCPQCFLLNQMIVSPFVHIFDITSLLAAEFKEAKIGISGKVLRNDKNMDLSEVKADS